MNHSAEFCLGQAALHCERAANAGLANVRSIAEKAAKAWESEAALAEARERRRGAAKRAVSLAVPVDDDELPHDCRMPDADEYPDDAALIVGTNENPDREIGSAEARLY
jgi:hypothetical protein